jgi:glycosyltransferase involved in cell wall biosynthesis
MLDPTRVLFIGVGSTPICYYRCALPAHALGADWVGVHGEPPSLIIDTGVVKGKTQRPTLLGGDYDVILMQEVYGEGWLKLIADAQAQGIKVIYEINDYLHGIASLGDHDFAQFYSRERIAEVEECMKAADAVTVTTKYLKTKYRKFAKRIYLVPNGIDPKRYDLELPTRGDKINVGWAGATGHMKALEPWLVKVAHLMDTMENVNFVSIGQPIADLFVARFGADRAISVPWAAIEQYPAAMTLLDIAIAPAANTKFHRGKSDLRWLEAGALGIPAVVNPVLYPEMQHGVTGLAAMNQDQVFEYMLILATDPKLRADIGEAVRTHVRENRTIEAMLPKWRRALELKE